jgi:phosphocarrier protein HPr
MVTIKLKITNESGLHARPATQFAMQAKEFACTVNVRNVDQAGAYVNGKSMLRLLSQGFSKGTVMEIATDGDDEERASQTLRALVESGFGE